MYEKDITIGTTMNIGKGWIYEKDEYRRRVNIGEGCISDNDEFRRRMNERDGWI